MTPSGGATGPLETLQPSLAGIAAATLRVLLAGYAWVKRRHPGAPTRPPTRPASR